MVFKAKKNNFETGNDHNIIAYYCLDVFIDQL